MSKVGQRSSDKMTEVSVDLASSTWIVSVTEARLQLHGKAQGVRKHPATS